MQKVDVILRGRNNEIIKQINGVEAPDNWSILSITTAATKYFIEG